MKSVVRLAACLALSGAVIAPPAAAADADKRPAARKNDPDQIVCERQEILGSRLSTRKVCHTRQEWAEQRRGDREAVTRAQTGVCVKNAGC